MDIMNLTIQGQDKDLVQTYWDKLSKLSLRAKLQLASLLTNMAQRYTKILSHPSHQAEFPVYRCFK